MCEKRNHHGASRLVALAGVFSLLALGSTQVLSGQDGNKSCNDGTIKGTYGIQMQGSRPAGPGATETVIGVVLRTFDGRGGFEQVDNIKGSVSGITLDRSGEGTYEVAADYSGVTQFQPDPENPGIVIEEKFVIVNRGDELRSITTSPPPLMVTSTGKRVRGH